jgi:hypothetical protein
LYIFLVNCPTSHDRIELDLNPGRSQSSASCLASATIPGRRPPSPCRRIPAATALKDPLYSPFPSAALLSQARGPVDGDGGVPSEARIGVRRSERIGVGVGVGAVWRRYGDGTLPSEARIGGGRSERIRRRRLLRSPDTLHRGRNSDSTSLLV